MNQADLLDAIPWAVPGGLLVLAVAIYLFGGDGDWGWTPGGLPEVYNQAEAVAPDWVAVGLALLALGLLLNGVVEMYKARTSRTNR